LGYVQRRDIAMNEFTLLFLSTPVFSFRFSPV
jgi:hypothetical protein